VISRFDSSGGRGRLLGVGGESRGIADEVLRDFTGEVTGGEQGSGETERSGARSIFQGSSKVVTPPRTFPPFIQ
jgi:hypothetical protein